VENSGRAKVLAVSFMISLFVKNFKNSGEMRVRCIKGTDDYEGS